MYYMARSKRWNCRNPFGGLSETVRDSQQDSEATQRLLAAVMQFGSCAAVTRRP